MAKNYQYNPNMAYGAHPMPSAPAIGMYPSIDQTPLPSVMVVQNTTPFNFGPHPVRATCPSCHHTDMSKIQYVSTTRTHMMAMLCFTLCCCCLPYVMKSCRNADHLCKNCGAYLGSYQK